MHKPFSRRIMGANHPETFGNVSENFSDYLVIHAYVCRKDLHIEKFGFLQKYLVFGNAFRQHIN